MPDHPPELQPASLPRLLDRRAEHTADRTAYTFVDSDDTVSLTYRELRDRVRSVAAALREHAAPGDRALLLYPPGLDFVAAFYGCLYAGVVAVPAYPPTSGRSLPRLAGILADAGARVALTTGATLPVLAELHDSQAGLVCLPTDDLPAATPPGYHPAPGDPALLQYTSGSTSVPRGVMVSHGNLMANSAHISELFGCTPDDRAVVWLPSYHDMGLIGGVIQPLYAGFPVTLMAPMAFVRSPYLWLRTISETGATISGGPNFGYDLSVRSVSAEQRATLDLSRWRVAFNGAEPVRAASLERFTEAFAPTGFRPEAFLPCYGLAEATLLVTGADRSTAPEVATFDREALTRGVATTPGDRPARELVGCGRPPAGVQVRIVDPDTQKPCADDTVGEVWVAGPGVAGGYHAQAAETERLFGARIAGSEDGPYLRTGDLGLLHGGSLFVTGRLKDLIIVRGRNFDPHDLEATVEQAHPAIRPSVAAFTIDGDEDEERLVVVCEADRNHPRFDPAGIAAAVRQAVSAQHELQVADVVLVRAGKVPRTTSGKVQRHACRQRLLDGTLDPVAHDSMPAGPEAEADVPVTPGRDLLQAAAGPQERARLLGDYLLGEAAAALRIDRGALDLSRPLNESGVDSLAAVRFQHRVEVGLGVVLPLGDLLGGASLADLAGRLAERPEAYAEQLPAATSGTPGAGRPLSVGQHAMWFLHRIAPESPAYTIACALRITADLDTDALRRAFEALVERHPVLRTSYPTVDDEPVQVVGSGLPDGWFRSVDASGWDETTFGERLAEAANRPFDLAHGPVLRVDLFRRADDDQVMLLAVQHIAADFWSVEIVLRELGMLYSPGRQALPPAPPVTYADYADWLAQLVAGPEGDRLWAHWQEVLGGELPVLQLPTDRPRPAVQSYAGAIERFTVGPRVTAALRDLAEQHRTTLYTVLLAAFEVLLHRYSGQTDLIVGSPMAARGRAAFAGLVGQLSNTLPLRADLSGDPAFADFLERTRETVVAAIAHQDFPFAAMVERLGGSRDARRSPVFQHAFTFQQAHLSGSSELAALAFAGTTLRGRLGELPVESVVLDRSAAQFDISLLLAETEAGMAGSLTYNTDLFDAATMARMAADLTALLTGVAASPGRRISTLPLQTAVQTAREAGTPAAGPAVHHLIEDQVARTPGAVAVVDGGTEVGYDELNKAANRLARHLLSSGARPHGRVGVVLEPGLAQVMAVLAVLKAGSAYVPVDPGYPAERVEFMLSDANVDVVLTQESLRTGLPTGDAVVLCVDGPGYDEPDGDLPRTGGGADLAAVLYTSGSTGRPKGVIVTHAGLCTQVRGLNEVMDVRGEDRHLLAQSLAFAASARQLTVPLCHGASVVLASRDQAADPVALFELVRRTGVTIMSVNPTLWRHCVDALDRLAPDARETLLDNRLRLLLSASEPLTPDVPRWWLEHLAGRARFVNLLGHTEISGIASAYPVPADGGRGATVEIGAPLTGIDVYILNESLQPAPLGVPGEMYLGGAALTRGYLNRPDLTAERLLPNPFGVPGERLYRTGDLVRQPADGPMEHLGRVDDQLKVRGFRIEPAEVESVLDRHPGLRASVVTAPAEASGQRRLTAHVVPATEPAPTTSELRRYLQQHLPDYLVPSVIVTLPELPVNANGKVDRRALPEPDEVRPSLDDPFVAPRSELEQVIAAVWTEVLTVDQVGVHDSFFDLGGTSLSLTVVHGQLCERLGIEIAVAKLFQFPTVHTLAGHLGETTPDASAQIAKGRATAVKRRDRLDAARARRRGSST